MTAASTITTDQSLTTLINVFTVSPSDQEALVEVLITATDEVMRHQPGFISANFHASADGTRVVNYAQWRSQADFQAMITDSEVAEHFAAVNDIAAAQPHLYEVVSVHHA